MNRSAMARALLPAALALTGVAHGARAQRLEGALGVQQTTYRFEDSGGFGELSGLYLGASVAWRTSSVRIAGGGWFGELDDPNAALPARDVRITGLSVSYVPAPWLEVGLAAQARHAVAGSDTTVLRLLGPFARAAIDLGGRGLQGTAELTYYPISGVANLEPVSLAVQAGVGLRYAPPNSAVTVQAGYRLLRVDYASTSGGLFGGGSSRLEQEQGLVLELHVHGKR